LPVNADEALEIYPKTISDSCFGGRAVSYDECGLQRDLFDRALRTANKAGKRLLVVYGAEWCIWCHVFKEHIKGNSGKFNYTIEGQSGYAMDEHATADDRTAAKTLAAFAADEFIVVNIEAQHSFDGYSVLDHTGAVKHIGQTIPYIFVVDKNGAFIRDMPDSTQNKHLEKRRDTDDWYRGYNRKVLIAELKKLAH
jgi:thioredoxin-related protein